MAHSRRDDLDARLRAANVARLQDDAFFDALAEHAAASEVAGTRRRPTAARITAAVLGTGLLLSGGAVASAFILINSDRHDGPEPRPATILEPSARNTGASPYADGTGDGGTSRADVSSTEVGQRAQEGDEGHSDHKPNRDSSGGPQPPGNAYGVHGQTPQGHAYGHDHAPPPGQANGHANRHSHGAASGPTHSTPPSHADSHRDGKPPANVHAQHRRHSQPHAHHGQQPTE